MLVLLGAGKYANDAAQKIAFTRAAVSKGDPLANKAVISPVVRAGLKWIEARQPWQVERDREHVICSIEACGAGMWVDGTREKWFSDCDDHVRNVSETVNGGLFQKLLEDAGAMFGFAVALLHFSFGTGYDDVECVQMFRKGVLPCES